MGFNMKKSKVHLLFWPLGYIVSMIGALSLFGIYLFTIIFEPTRVGLLHRIDILVMWTISAVGATILYVCLGARQYLSLITIDETGISRSFLGIFHKLHIPWDDMREACYKFNMLGWLFFSKTKKMSEIPFHETWKTKDYIHISLSKKRYNLIMQYLQQPIIDMPESLVKKYTKLKSEK